MEESATFKTAQHPATYSHSSPAMASIQPRPHANVVTVLPTTIQTTMVTTSLPVYESDHLAYSIMTMLCCFLPLGLAALVFSFKTQSCNQRGDVAGARENSRTALILNHIALGVGIAVAVAYISYVIYYLVTLNRRSSYSSSYYGSYYYKSG